MRGILGMRKSWTEMVVVMLAFVIVTTGLLMSPKQAYACSCAMPESVAVELGRSDAVFDGTVVASSKPAKWFKQSSADRVIWSFQAHEVWKGQVSSSIQVKSAQSGASCGFGFQEGQRYIVYARDVGEGLEVSLCSRTALQAAASTDIAELGSGSIPPAPDGDEAASSVSPAVWLNVIGLALIILTAVYVGHRIKNKGLKK